MSKTRDLASKFRLPDQDSGSAQCTSIDLMGSTHEAFFTWDHEKGELCVATKIDGLESLKADFYTVARSLRLRESSGFTADVSGSKGIANHLAKLFMQGPSPTSQCPTSTSRVAP